MEIRGSPLKHRAERTAVWHLLLLVIATGLAQCHHALTCNIQIYLLRDKKSIRSLSGPKCMDNINLQLVCPEDLSPSRAQIMGKEHQCCWETAITTLPSSFAPGQGCAAVGTSWHSPQLSCSVDPWQVLPLTGSVCGSDMSTIFHVNNFQVEVLINADSPESKSKQRLAGRTINESIIREFSLQTTRWFAGHFLARHLRADVVQVLLTQSR